MRHTLLVATVALMALSACSEGRAQDAGPMATRTFPVGSFTKLEVAGPFDVSVSTGKQPSASVQGPQKLLEKMVVEVDGDTLKVHPEKGGWMNRGFRWTGDHAKLTITVPTLQGAAIAGSGNMSVDRVSGDRFRGSIAGSGKLELPAVAVSQLQLEIAGSGDVQAAGRTQEASYEIAGSGNIRAGQVDARDARASIAGSGNIQGRASGTAKVNIAGSGDVEITGGAKCTVSKAGSGNVRCS